MDSLTKTHNPLQNPPPGNHSFSKITIFDPPRHHIFFRRESTHRHISSDAVESGRRCDFDDLRVDIRAHNFYLGSLSFILILLQSLQKANIT